LVAGLVGGAFLFVQGTALAHIESDPGAVEAGKTATVGFVVEHGCEGSPTVELRFQVPAEVTQAQPVDKAGWTTAVDDRVVSFSGGSLDPETTDTFEIEFVAPSEPGTIYFPVVQRCEDGETSWIEIPTSDATELDLPAPAVEVTAGPPTSDEVADGHDEGDGNAHHEAEPTEEVADAAEDTESEGSGGVSGGLIAAGVIAVVVVGGTVLLVRRRRDTTG
jgi:uncharacterized protein YcnI